MQDDSVIGWDPIHIWRPTPWETQLFFLYWLVIMLVTATRVLILVRQLSSFGSFKKRLSHDGVAPTPESLAASALGSRPLPATAEIEQDRTGLRSVIEQADARFIYMWRTCSAEIESMSRLARFTLLLSALTSVLALMRWATRIVEQKSFAIWVVAQNIRDWMTPLCLGLIACVVMYAVTGFYEGVLARRRIAWEYFCARVKMN